jgi:NitT/TauT family transport system substrate-binding protein
MFETISAVVQSKMKRNKKMNIKPKDLIIDRIKENPEIKNRLLDFSTDFKKLNDPWIFNIIANLSTFENLALLTGVKVDELIEYLNTGVKTLQGVSSEADTKPDWVENNKFIEIDARKLSGFFLKDILKKESELDEKTGLKVIQNFHAAPLITLMEGKGYETYSEKLAEDLFNFYFFKTKNIDEKRNAQISKSGKPTMVVQSATPVVYPVLLKLLQSERFNSSVEVTEYKVWDETEKHLGWIVNGKADLSFSAILAMSNLTSNKDIIKLTNITVWDNFYVLTRGYKAESWEDVKGHDIYMPLFFNAPPAKVTHYLMEENGYNPKDFNFVYGKPFGRPEEIMRDLINGKIDTALLREPEVSYTLVNNPDVSVAFSYNELWENIHPESKGLPNAGVVFKSEWFEKYPNEAKIVMEEIDKAVNWVKNNPKEAAELSYKEMGQSFEEVYKFLNRVTFDNVPAEDYEKEIVEYLSVIEGKEKARTAISKMLYRQNPVKLEINL